MAPALPLVLALSLAADQSTLHDQGATPLSRYLSDVWQTEQGLPQNGIQAIAQTPDGYLWLGTPGGLVRFDGVHFTVFNQGQFQNNNIHALLADRRGRLWIGTYGGGLYQYENGRFRSFSTDAGLESAFVRTLYETRDGTLWIGTDHGLNRFKDGRFSVFTMQQGLPDDIVNSILEDDTGNLWIGCERGIYRISKQFLNDLAAQRTKSVEPVLYDRGDGMDTEDTNGQKSQPAAFRTRDGRLWFATVAGVAVINPHNLPQNKVPPPVVIEQVVADHEVVFDNANAPVAAAVRRRNGDSSQ